MLGVKNERRVFFSDATFPRRFALPPLRKWAAMLWVLESAIFDPLAAPRVDTNKAASKEKWPATGHYGRELVVPSKFFRFHAGQREQPVRRTSRDYVRQQLFW